MEFRKTLRRFILINLAIVLILIVSKCEGDERFYRPNLPEQLSCIGIIDLDDTILRHISFEKSFQIEYPEEVNDSLREFSFTLSSSGGDIFSYNYDSTIKNIKDLRIPDSITFSPGEKYYLRAKEKDTPEIYAEIIATRLPSEPELISIKQEVATISEPIGCIEDSTVSYVIINFSFKKDRNLHYAILTDGAGLTLSSGHFRYTGFLDFSVREGNTPGFFAEMQGLKVFHYSCTEGIIEGEESPVYAYFIEGNKIADSICRLTISIQYRDSYCLFEAFKSLRIKIMSIPKELYLFEKSLYTYKKTTGDPFTEPIYLNGNIKEGNGVFAICRSTEISKNFPFPL